MSKNKQLNNQLLLSKTMMEWMEETSTLMDYYHGQQVLAFENGPVYVGSNEDISKWKKDSMEKTKRIFTLISRLEQMMSSNEYERNMYCLLALWFCSYFQKVPRLDIWVDITVIANKIGGYPGGAFYFKLCGDIYRFERRMHLKNMKNKLVSEFYHAKNRIYRDIESSDMDIENTNITAMTFSPIMLLPNTFTPTQNWSFSDELSSDMAIIEKKFRENVEKLSWRYVLKQLSKYSKSGLPLEYYCAQQSLCEAIYMENAMLLKRIPAKADVKKYYNSLNKKTTNEWLSYFLELPKNANQNIVVISNKCIDHLSITSSLVGSVHGAVVNRPNRPNIGWGMVRWIDGIRLESERHKIKQMMEEAIKIQKESTSENLVITLENEHSASEFFDLWYDENAITTRFRDMVNSKLINNANNPQKISRPEIDDY